jgi:hypothetical protein
VGVYLKIRFGDIIHNYTPCAPVKFALIDHHAQELPITRVLLASRIPSQPNGTVIAVYKDNVLIGSTARRSLDLEPTSPA